MDDCNLTMQDRRRKLADVMFYIFGVSTISGPRLKYHPLKVNIFKKVF